MLLALLVGMGCIADTRLPSYATNEHLVVAAKVATAEQLPVLERLTLIMFHVTQAKAWNLSIIRQKGELPEPERFEIPLTPDDKRKVINEAILLKEHNADVDDELNLKAKGNSLLTKILGGTALGGTGLASLAAMFLKYKKKVKGMMGLLQAKDRAIDQYDAAIDKLPKAKRNEIAKGDDMDHEHAVRRNGG